MTVPQSTIDPPEVVGISYAADIIKRERQLILVLRECVTSYTACCFVVDERRDTMRDRLSGQLMHWLTTTWWPSFGHTHRPSARIRRSHQWRPTGEISTNNWARSCQKRQQEPDSRESCSRARVRACTTYRWHRYSTCAFSRYCKPQHSRTKQGVFCSRVVDTTPPVH